MYLKVNDSFLNDDLSIANCMNSYFSSVFTVEDYENFPDLEYITDKKLCNIFGSATNGLENKISRAFLDFLHLGHEFFVISGHGT